MHPDLHRYLDGELPREALSPDLSIEAELWDAVLDDVAELRRGTAPPWLEARVMAALPQRPPASVPRRLLDWLVAPRPIRVRPVVALAATATAAALLLLARPPAAPEPREVAPPVALEPTEPSAPPSATQVIYIQFIFAAEDAHTVAVAGDFNGWNPEHHELRDPDGDGVWTGLFAIPPGLHKYMFLVDGQRWETDPRAERYVDDGFGMRNALLNVAVPAGRAS